MTRAARALLVLAVAMLGACASGWDEGDEARCRAIEDAAARRACLEQLLSDARTRDDNGGIGPPPCHPASTLPDRDRERC